MSQDPDSGTIDRPYVLLGASEYTLSEVHELGRALLALAEQANAASTP